MKKRNAAIAVIVFLAAAGLIAAITGLARAKADSPAVITLVHPFESPTWQAAISAELGEFEALFPRYRVNARFREPGSIIADCAAGTAEWDIAIASSRLLGYGGAFAGPPTGWAGSGWLLYANQETLDDAGVSLPADYTVHDLETALRTIRAAGVTPITVGAQFGWPQAIWVQAIAAATDPETAVAMGTKSADIESTAVAGALDRFRGWIDAGLVNPNREDTDWPESLSDLLAGKAAFCLINQDLTAHLRERSRSKLTAYPLPGSIRDGRAEWMIGSLDYIGRNARSPVPKASDALYGYLTSEGVTARLGKALGAPFFAKGTGPRTIVPSVTDDASDPLIDLITRSLAR